MPATARKPPHATFPVNGDRLVGTSVAHYAVVSRLGAGAQGVVYAARDQKLNRLVALKFLPPQLSDDEWAKQRFIREAQAGSAAEHNNICAIHGIETAEDGRLFIVMAYYEGRTLKEKLHDGPLGVEEAIHIAAQVTDGLAAAHARGVVHRDVKPGNLILTGEGVKILDFGLARLADSLQLTIDGSTLGTIAYMSPEQTRGEDVDARSDLWSAGAVLYEMLSGEAPFRGSHPDAICYAIRNDPPLPLATRTAGIPPALERVIARALCKDRRGRFQTADDMADALRVVQGSARARLWTRPWSASPAMILSHPGMLKRALQRQLVSVQG